MYISDQDNFRNTSMFTAGGYDVDRFAWNQTVTWNAVTDDLYWTVNLKKAAVGDTMIITSTKSAIIDSGTSFLAMPDTELRSLVDLLGSVHGFNCWFDEHNALYACDCPDINEYKDNFPPLKITLGETNTYEVPSKDYTHREQGICFLTVLQLQGDDFWILGDSFMRNYYAIFDLDNRRVGLAGSSV